MHVVHHPSELGAILAPLRESRRRIALVPTMGNLHAGHLALVARAKREAEVVVVSIFVNPLQFGVGEDFERYPRTLDADVEKLQAAGADVVFAPAVADIYPNGYPPTTRVHVSGDVSACLEGAFRPGHFDGVATVVAILFNCVQPDVAIFGEKDWQQLQIIQRMAQDLGFGIAVLGEPIVRAPDGLALSSRNQYLSADERKTAPRLHAALAAIARELVDGRRDFHELCHDRIAQLTAVGFLPQYLEIRRPGLAPSQPADTGFSILAAALLGKTRLIDNVRVTLAQRDGQTVSAKR
ncbi:MAG: pantoate--beta-alanine ligase [Nevskiaceae bacterium]|nr:MAG: pantoate--beta-alanine ligase [Nevskiaceae bacterium]TBR73519.1 MAG: pantoate--beta-alanine ligase [Nevskiaceae bacterium]